MSQKSSTSSHKSNLYLFLVLIWLLATLSDRLWLWLDRSVPAWDQANHLTGSLNYLNALENAQWFNGEWWRNLWMLSSKNPPLTYIVTAPFQYLLGKGVDQALWVHSLYTAILLFSVYLLGKHLFNQQVGLWSAALCILFPRLYSLRLQYLIDYPLTALVTASFCCLTIWKDAKTSRKQWLWAIGLGICLGLTVMTKQSFLFFLLVPTSWVFLTNLFRKNWARISQLITSFILATFIFFPWYSTNWIYFFGVSDIVIGAAQQEGDPPLNTLAAWTYYWQDLPGAISLPLLFIALGTLILFLLINIAKNSQNLFKTNTASNIYWLAIFWLSSYFICSALFNKDWRYIAPYLPIISILLAYGLTLLPLSFRWVTAIVAIVLMIFNLFPLGGNLGNYLVKYLSPAAQSHPYQGKPYPHQEVIAEIIATTPQLRANLGLLSDSPEVNHNNMNYYGNLANFQVYGREIGTRDRFMLQDRASLDWFLSQTGTAQQNTESQAKLSSLIAQSPDFQLQKTWELPDDTQLHLYHRTSAPIGVKAINTEKTRVNLDRVMIPSEVPPGQPVPVTYQWSGNLRELASGIVLLTWKNKYQGWFHDHGIARGELYLPPHHYQNDTFQVTERMAMFPSENIAPGEYTLEAIYLNRHTGEIYPLNAPQVKLKISPNAPNINAPALDLVSQIRLLAKELPQGRKALDRIFDEIGRINQYDPIQDYVVQAEIASNYRLSQEPENLDIAYALTLAQVLQEDAPAAISTLKKIVTLDSKNPYAYAYLAFVYLYHGHPQEAEKAIESAIALEPELPELKLLSGVAALMRGNLMKAYQEFFS